MQFPLIIDLIRIHCLTHRFDIVNMHVMVPYEITLAFKTTMHMTKPIHYLPQIAFILLHIPSSFVVYEWMIFLIKKCFLFAPLPVYVGDSRIVRIDDLLVF